MNKIQRPNMKSLPAEELCALVWTCGGGRDAAHELASRLAKAQAEIESLKAEIAADDRNVNALMDQVHELSKEKESLKAQLAECRDKALEEAATLADDMDHTTDGDIARYTRSLKSKKCNST